MSIDDKPPRDSRRRDLQQVHNDAPTYPELPGLNRPASLGRMPLLRRPVTLYDPQSNQFEVLSCNDAGAVIAGPAPPNRSDAHLFIRQLRLGRREQHQDHFFLVDVIDSEEVRQGDEQPWTRFRVRWNAFAGSSAGATSDFAARHLRIDLDARRVKVTHPTPPAPVPAAPRRDLGAERVAAMSRMRPPTSKSHRKPPTTPSGLTAAAKPNRAHSNRRGKTPVSMRRPRTPLSIPRTALPAEVLAAGAPTADQPSPVDTKPPGMGPTTEERLLKGRRPIPLGSGD